MEFKKLAPSILSVAIIIIGSMVFFSIIGFNLNPVQDKQIEKIVDIEAFNGIENSPEAQGFCKSNIGNSVKLQESCSSLIEDNCRATSCCVYADIEGTEQCHAGDIHGPTFRRDENGKTKNIDYYYFRNKCYGQGCPK